MITTFLRFRLSCPRDEASFRLAQGPSRGRGWYLPARCDVVDGLRVFRVDQIEGGTAGRALPDPEGLRGLRDGRALVSEVEAGVRIRFDARVARWIAEREGGEVQADGSYVQELLLADLDWLVGRLRGMVGLG